jgi:hypothetical protein
LPLGTSPAHALNLFAGFLAALTATLVCAIATRILQYTQPCSSDASAPMAASAGAAGAALGALAFAFSGTLWEYAVMFTPYVLSALFTALIFWTMLRWWESVDRPNAWRLLAWLAFLFGLDFSVHRTNALLIPGALAWILVRDPKALRSLRVLVAGTGALVAGLLVQLLVIPIATFTRSPLNFSDPSSLDRFWDYVTIKQLGGSFLLNLFPRKSAPWSVQTMDLLHVLRNNFVKGDGRTGALAALSGLAVCVGLVALWRRNRRLAAAYVTVLVLQMAFTVLYFNIPPDYFRTFDRHYLPVCVTIAVLMAYGLGAAMSRAATLLQSHRRLAAAAIVTLVAIVPVAQLARNWSVEDASNRYFTKDYATNALLSVPRNAIYFTVGDNDTFPLMYFQSVEGVRPDVTIINLSVANIPAWPDQLKRRDPSLPLTLSIDQRRALSARPWTDTSVTIPVSRPPDDLGLPPGTTLPESIALDVRPAYGRTMLPAEIVLLDIVRSNGWKRPLTFAVTGAPSSMGWLKPYGRLEGLYYRIVPVESLATDGAVLREHLLESAQYRGYADSSVRIDDVSRTMGMQYYAGLEALLDDDRAHGSPGGCRSDRDAVLAKLPFERLRVPAEYRRGVESACDDARNP